jgi:hypothetical protein
MTSGDRSAASGGGVGRSGEVEAPGNRWAGEGAVAVHRDGGVAAAGGGGWWRSVKRNNNQV